MRPTIKDVAKLAGVSPATVSIVLNNRPESISKETREAVHKAAAELQYRPNLLAVSLVTKKTNTIALIIPDNTNLFFGSMSNAIEMATTARNYSLIYANTNNSFDMSLHYLRLFSDQLVDGIIIAQSEFDNPESTIKFVEAIRESHPPIVLVDRVSQDSDIDYVALDQFEGGYLATTHLINLGHKVIGCVSGYSRISTMQERLRGYHFALEEAGITFDPDLVYEGELQLETGIDALPYLLGKNVTAVFAFNDMIAYGIYKESRSYNLEIPKDLSIIGFDDLAFSDIIAPPLTTMEQPINAIASAAVDRLIELINNPAQSVKESKVLRPTLKVRGSTIKNSR